MGAVDVKIEFLWFDGCPSHEEARRLLQEVLTATAVDHPILEVNASDPDIANKVHFPGSPTIRVNGQDIEPGFADPGDYSPRCRLYSTSAGLTGVPERRWIEGSLVRALAMPESDV